MNPSLAAVPLPSDLRDLPVSAHRAEGPVPAAATDRDAFDPGQPAHATVLAPPPAIDFSVEHWWRRVPVQQWRHEESKRAALDPALSPLFAESRSLAEVHRLDLALFVVFEEVALRVSGALVRHAPTPQAMSFAAQQTLDEAHHFELFLGRSDQARQLAGQPTGVVDPAILTPPLRRFIDHCYEVADRGHFLEGLTLTNLLLEGMAYPLYAYEERYWQPIDPYLAGLVRSAFVDETRHVHYGAALLSALLSQDPDARPRIQTMVRQARTALREAFGYYVHVFVGLFDAVARRHRGLFEQAELAPGLRIADTPYAEQVAHILQSIEREHTRLLSRCGLAD